MQKFCDIKPGTDHCNKPLGHWGSAIWKTIVSRRRVTRLPEPLWASQRFVHFLKKRGKPLTRETNSWLGWKGGQPSSELKNCTYFLSKGRKNSKTGFLKQHFFRCLLYISLPSLHNYDVKKALFHDFTYRGGPKVAIHIRHLRIFHNDMDMGLQEISPNFEKVMRWCNRDDTAVS